MPEDGAMNTRHADANPLKDRRRWWVALLMLFPTGAGYIYVGRPWRFVGFTGFVILYMAAFYYGNWDRVNNRIAFVLFMVIVSVAALGFAADLITIAIKQDSHDLRWPQRRKWYVAGLVIWTALAFAPSALGNISKNETYLHQNTILK